MYPKSNRNDDSLNDEKCTSSTETITADDQQVAIQINLVSDDEFEDAQDDFYLEYVLFKLKTILNY